MHDVRSWRLSLLIPVPMAFLSFGGWKRSLFGDVAVYGSKAALLYAARDDDRALAQGGARRRQLHDADAALTGRRSDLDIGGHKCHRPQLFLGRTDQSPRSVQGAGGPPIAGTQGQIPADSFARFQPRLSYSRHSFTRRATDPS